MKKNKNSVYKTGKIKVSLYAGVLNLSELQREDSDEFILPLGIIIDKENISNNDYILTTYYNIPKIDEGINISYSQISTSKLADLFFDDKIFLDKLIFLDGREKQINYISFNIEDFILGFIKKRRLFNKKRDTENISLGKMAYECLSEYLKEIRKNKVLTEEEVAEIHKRGNITIGEIVREWESLDLCVPGDGIGSAASRCDKFGNCHDCLIDYASYSLEHTSMSSFFKLTNLEDLPPIERPKVTLFEIYDTEECISGFFDTKEELDLYINTSGGKGNKFKLEYYSSKDGVNNVVREISENGEVSYYKIIDEEICVPYIISDENIQYIGKPVDLVYWPITDVLKAKGISFDKDKCKVKKW